MLQYTNSFISSVKQISKTSVKETKDEKFGIWFGVFFPCLQNILGVILFLRLPWIVGQAGTLQSTLIVLLCVSSTTLTTLSMSALATNGKVPAGGPYAILTKTLGPEVGGSVGMLFYVILLLLGTTTAVTLYVLGAVEALFSNFDIGVERRISLSNLESTNPELYACCIEHFDETIDSLSCNELFPFDQELLGFLLSLAMGLTVYVGISFVAKIAIVFLFIVIVAILLIIIGLIRVGTGGAFSEFKGSLSENFDPSFERDPETNLLPSFTSLIALFYPSVTGIMAGSNRSGVLRSPSSSIPLGTLGAIATTTSIYIFMIWLFGSTLTNEVLKEDKLVSSTIAWPNSVPVGVGIIMSSVGAGLQSLTGAPQLLQKISDDGYIGFLSVLQSKENENGSAEQDRASGKSIAVTALIAGLICGAGNIDFITPIITMFFLSMYGSINLACFVSGVTKSTGFRPTWKYFHWGTALSGAVLCLILMFMISIIYAFVAIFLIIALFLYVSATIQKKEWGDAIVGLRLGQAIQSLLALTETQDKEKEAALKGIHWRPQILVLCKVYQTPSMADEYGVSRPGLLRMAAQLKKSGGLVSAVTVVDEEKIPRSKLASLRMSFKENLHKQGVRGFSTVVHTKSADFLSRKLAIIFQSNGLGSLSPNTVLMGWPRGWGLSERSVQNHLETCERTNESLICSCYHKTEFVSLLKEALNCEKAVVIVKSVKRKAKIESDSLLESKDTSIRKSLAVRLAATSRRDRNLVRQPSTSFDHDVEETKHLSIRAMSSRRIKKLKNNVTSKFGSSRNSPVKVQLKQKAWSLNYIDVWWLISDGGVLILLPFLLTKHRKWKNSKLRIFAIQGQSYLNKTYKTKETLKRYLEELRIPAEVNVVPITEPDMKDLDHYRTIVAPKKQQERRSAKSLFEKEMENTKPKKTISFGLSPEAVNERANRLETAARINKLIVSYSKSSHLVIINLPLSRSTATEEFVTYTEILTKELDKVLLIRSNGHENIQDFSTKKK
eukprot:maker-scaffold_6-snap-gene-18.45-mRNA-1 protein AED:0.08 eAED:0.12 QI:0/0/0/1/0.8/0.66/6/0/1007